MPHTLHPLQRASKYKFKPCNSKMMLWTFKLISRMISMILKKYFSEYHNDFSLEVLLSTTKWELVVLLSLMKGELAMLLLLTIFCRSLINPKWWQGWPMLKSIWSIFLDVFMVSLLLSITSISLSIDSNMHLNIRMRRNMISFSIWVF